MKKFLICTIALLLGCGLAFAQKQDYTITHSGWGRLETGSKVAITPYETFVSELDIHRWRKAKGTLTLDEGEKTVTIRLPRKGYEYTLLTESYVHKALEGWSYVEHQALENNRTFCRVWVCTHQDGTKQFLVLYPTFVQGYKLIPAE